MAFFIYGLFFGCYLPANRLASMEACFDLTLPADRAIPLQPVFVYPFYLVYAAMILPAFLVKSRALLIRGGLAFGALIAVSCIIFVAFPTCVPRPEFSPHSEAGRLLARIWAMDRPVCGCPSLHVSASVLAATIVIRERRTAGVVLLAASLLTSVSTLFVKQHVILDVAGGVAMALIVDAVILRGRGSKPRVKKELAQPGYSQR